MPRTFLLAVFACAFFGGSQIERPPPPGPDTLAGAAPPPETAIDVLPPRPARVHLPIRVIGLDGATRTRTLFVEEAAGIDRLWMRVHRPAYRDQQVNSSRDAKASVRVNEGAWVDLTNENVQMPAPEEESGGVGGGFYTVRLSVPVSNVRAGENTVAFRFNGTDGLTSGYRVIGVNFLRDGKKVLPEDAFEMDDPATWAPPQGFDTPQDIQAGKDLWYHAKLVESLEVGRDMEPIKATCSGCHAATGHDLKYFAYHNSVIQTRAEFHGLTAKQGKQIAAYIRSLTLETQDGSTYEAPGRPWNPPYQPAPGLSEQPVHAWAAGAGLEAVLPHDSLMWRHLEEEGSMIRAFDADREIRVYDQPIALQLEDWNQWLPRFHPVDVFGSHFTEHTDEVGEGDTWRDDVLGHFEAMKAGLADKGAAALAKGGNAMHKFGGAARKGYFDMLGGHEHVTRPDFSGERAELAMKKWALVKIWQEMQAYHLADEGRVLYGDDAEPRTWLSGNARVPFEIAPHISAGNTTSYAWQTTDAGNYQSTAWYQVQMILNAGNNHGGSISPVDWNYQPMFVQSQGHHAARQAQTFAKMLQQFTDEDRPPGKVYVRQIHPGLYGPGGKYAAPFDHADPQRKAQAYTALLSALMDKLEAHTASDWRAAWGRPAGSAGPVLRPATHVPKEVTNQSIHSALHGRDFRWADGFYTMIPRFADAGVARPVLERMTRWGEEMWPRGDWQSLDLNGAPPSVNASPSVISPANYKQPTKNTASPPPSSQTRRSAMR